MQSITLQTNDTIVVSGDILGRLQFAASAESDGGAARLIGAGIYGMGEGSFSSSSNPASLVFITSDNDANAASAKLKISHEGHFLPISGSYNIGESSNRFNSIYGTGLAGYSLELASNVPSDTTNKLYNDGGTLKFNGSAVGGAGGGGGLDNVVEDTTPQLGGNLDLNSYSVTGVGNINIDGTIEANYIYGDLDGPIVVECKNSTGSTISAGTPVYVSGYYGTNGKALIAPADAADSSKMPAIGLLETALNDDSEGYVHCFGLSIGMNTASFSVGDTVYVASGEGITNTRPTASNVLVQNIGRVLRSDASQGRILVLGPGRTNDVPNSGNFEQLTVDEQTILAKDGGNVGIGTNIPTRKLDLRYPVAGGMALIKSSDSNDGLYIGDMNYNDAGVASNDFQGIRHVGMTGATDYMLMSQGTSTYISAKAGGGQVWIQGGGTRATNIQVYGDTLSNGVAIELNANNYGKIVLNNSSNNVDCVIKGTTDSELFYIDGSANMIGISTSSPTYTLDVAGTAGFSSTIDAPNLGTGEDNSVVLLDSDGKLRTDEIDSRVWGSSLIDGSGTTNYISKWSDSDTLTSSIIYDNGTNVGIGNAAPSSKLDVSGVITATGGNSTNWNTAYGWGDHSVVGYLTSHPTIIAASSVDNSNGSVIQDITLDSNGHVTVLGSVDLDSRYYTETEIDAFNYLANIAEDTTPQLGGNLDLNTYSVTGVGSIDISNDITADGELKIGGRSSTSQYPGYQSINPIRIQQGPSYPSTYYLYDIVTDSTNHRVGINMHDGSVNSSMAPEYTLDVNGMISAYGIICQEYGYGYGFANNPSFDNWFSYTRPLTIETDPIISNYSSRLYNNNNLAEGVLIGRGAHNIQHQGIAYATNYLTNKGDSQRIFQVLQVETTDATQTSLTNSDTSVLLTSTSSTTTFTLHVSAHNSTDSAAAGWIIRGCVKNVSGTASLVGSLIQENFSDTAMSSTSVDLTFSGANMSIKVTGLASKTIRWVASIDASVIEF